MPNTFELIASSTVGSGGASSISFTNIPQTYTDLQLLHSLRDTSNTGNFYIDVYWTVNGQTSASGKVIYSIDGSTAGSYSPTNIAVSENSSLSTASTFSNNSLYIPNYTSTGVKSISGEIIIERNATAAVVAFGAFTVTNGAAITSLTVTPYANFAQYSTAYLYGIKNS